MTEHDHDHERDRDEQFDGHTLESQSKDFHTLRIADPENPDAWIESDFAWHDVSGNA